MKNLYLLTGAFFFLTGIHSQAQPDTAKITQHALFFADSLVKTDAYEDWSDYAGLAPAGIIKYYGGKDGFISHVQLGRLRTTSMIQEETPELRLMNLLTQDNQWQCVIQQSRYFHKDDKKYHFITYFIGQSKDDGETWRFFDVSYNSVANIIYMFPDIFGDIPIKEPVIISTDDELAQQKAAETAAAATTSKKPAARKK